MLDRQRGFHNHRPSWTVDSNVDILAGMVAFLTTNASGVVVATTAASGTVPIGYFFNDSAAAMVRATIETGTFNANNIITVLKGNFHAAGSVKVTNAAGTVTYTQGVDYNLTLANGVVTRIGGGSIAASASVVIWYEYNVSSQQLASENASTRWVFGQDYNQGSNASLGSGAIAVVEGDAQLFTDQFDPTQTYVLNAVLRSDAASRWTTAASGYPVCGRVISVPTASDPFLGIEQVRVTQ